MNQQPTILQTAMPWIRSATIAVGAYKPLHSWWTGVLARRTGVMIRHYSNGTYELISKNRIIRYDNWDMAYFLALNFDYYFMAVESVAWRGYEFVDFSHSSWHRTLPSRELFFFNSLAEPESTTGAYLDSACLRGGETVLDLGAYNGTQTVLFSRAVGPRGRVIALEPDPLSFAALETNLSFHNVTNVTPMNSGAWDLTGTLEFCSDGSMGSSFVSPHIHSGKKIAVSVTSIADIIESHGLERVDFIKMDIEGAEKTVVESITAILQRFRPVLVIEPHRIDGCDSREPVVAHLEKCGYSCDVIEQGVHEMPLIRAKPTNSLSV